MSTVKPLPGRCSSRNPWWETGERRHDGGGTYRFRPGDEKPVREGRWRTEGRRPKGDVVTVHRKSKKEWGTETREYGTGRLSRTTRKWVVLGKTTQFTHRSVPFHSSVFSVVTD